jgi:urease gamma subunit
MKMHTATKRAPRREAAELKLIRTEIATLAAQLTAAETREEALIRSLEAQGRSVLRRPDATPAIVLAP